jgi:hypothetical protein
VRLLWPCALSLLLPVASRRGDTCRAPPREANPGRSARFPASA